MAQRADRHSWHMAVLYAAPLVVLNIAFGTEVGWGYVAGMVVTLLLVSYEESRE